MTTTAKRAFWLKLGWGPACLVALAPVIVALFHLAPMMRPPAERPAVLERSDNHPQSHHHHRHAAAAEPQSGASDTDGPEVLAAAAPADSPSHHARPHCPLCLWLQGFHALPTPDGLVLHRPRERILAFTPRETVLRIVAFRATAQPRAPPILLPA